MNDAISQRRAIAASVAAILAISLTPTPSRAQGSWSPVMDWVSAAPNGTNQVTQSCMSPEPHAFAHAAVIPKGQYAGRVLLWHCTASGTSTPLWVFDPNTVGLGNKLSVLRQTIPGDIFCAGQSWDSAGRLLIAGGFQQNLDQCWRLDPALLGLTIFPTGGGTPVITGTSVSALPNLAIDRYYPTLIPLNRRAVGACGSTSLPSRQLVLGGPPLNGQPGNDIWELLPQPSSPPNGCYLGPTTPQQTASGNHEVYTTSGSPETLLDSYPRAFQLSNDQVFIVNDVMTNLSTHITTPGQSWVINPNYTAGTQWKLSDGPNAATGSLGQRHYGNAVLIHQRGVAKNRIFTFGGSRDVNYGTTNPASYDVNNSMQEFVPGVNGSGQLDATVGTWFTHAPTGTGASTIGRMHANAVVLPTGQILIVGGSSALRPEVPVYPPTLYTPGQYNSGVPGAGTAELMATPNNAPGQTGPTPRLYHSVATLLQNGSVFVAGGENLSWSNPPTSFPRSDYTGEVFTPPYPAYRPTITACPTSATLSGSTFQVTANTVQGAITRVVLVRPAAVTHHFDGDQRLIELAFTASTAGGVTTLTVTPPADTLGPAGWYLLFVLEGGAQGDAPAVQGKFIQFS